MLLGILASKRYRHPLPTDYVTQISDHELRETRGALNRNVGAWGYHCEVQYELMNWVQERKKDKKMGRSPVTMAVRPEASMPSVTSSAVEEDENLDDPFVLHKHIFSFKFKMLSFSNLLCLCSRGKENKVGIALTLVRSSHCRMINTWCSLAMGVR